MSFSLSDEVLLALLFLGPSRSGVGVDVAHGGDEFRDSSKVKPEFSPLSLATPLSSEPNDSDLLLSFGGVPTLLETPGIVLELPNCSISSTVLGCNKIKREINKNHFQSVGIRQSSQKPLQSEKTKQLIKIKENTYLFRRF